MTPAVAMVGARRSGEGALIIKDGLGSHFPCYNSAQLIGLRPMDRAPPLVARPALSVGRRRRNVGKDSATREKPHLYPLGQFPVPPRMPARGLSFQTRR